jgi:hypothetical protein
LQNGTHTTRNIISRTVSTPTGEGASSETVDNPEPKTVSDKPKSNSETPPAMPRKGDIEGIDNVGNWLSQHGILRYPAAPGTPAGASYEAAHRYVEDGLKRYWAGRAEG